MEQHRIEILTGRATNITPEHLTVREGHVLMYQAICSCGYAGRSFVSKANAEGDGDEHVVQMCAAEK